MKLKLSTNNSFYPKAVAGIPIAHNLFGDFSYGKTRHFSPHFDAWNANDAWHTHFASPIVFLSYAFNDYLMLIIHIFLRAMRFCIAGFTARACNMNYTYVYVRCIRMWKWRIVFPADCKCSTLTPSISHSLTLTHYANSSFMLITYLRCSLHIRPRRWPRRPLPCSDCDTCIEFNPL